MKFGPSFHLVALGLVAVLAVFFWSSGAHQKHGGAFPKRTTHHVASAHQGIDDLFPRVYTTEVPLALYSNVTYVVGSLDILKIRQIREQLLITFLVHSHQELTRTANLLNSASQPIRYDFDEEATRNIHAKIRHGSLQQPRTMTENRGGRETYSTIDGFPCYRDVAGMEQFIIDLVDKAKVIPNMLVTLADIGDSYQKTLNESNGYDIFALNITGNGVQARGATTEKGVMLVLAGLHPREYAPPEVGARFAELLINGYGNDADITALLDHTEVHLVLQSNPDARFVAETSPFLWRRKNMNGDASICGEANFGVDLNRNFPFMWGLDIGSSSYPCSGLYRGVAPASEPEVKAIVDYASEIFPLEQRKSDPVGQIDEAYSESIKGIFIDIHSYGEYVVWPWAHKNRQTSNHRDLISIVDKQLYFNKHDFSGPSVNFQFIASGASDDWAYGALGTAAFTFEVGTRFYEDCGYFEASILPGNLLSLLYSAKISKAPYLQSKGPDVTSVTIVPQVVDTSIDSILTVTAIVSDSAYSTAGLSSSGQTISSVQLFIDRHPYDVVDGNPIAGLEMSCDCDKVTETVSLTLSMARVAKELSFESPGRHMLSIQGTDSKGYTGPVTSAFFEIAGSVPSLSPTDGPSMPAAAMPGGSPSSFPSTLTVSSSTFPSVATSSLSPTDDPSTTTNIPGGSPSSFPSTLTSASPSSISSVAMSSSPPTGDPSFGPTQIPAASPSSSPSTLKSGFPFTSRPSIPISGFSPNGDPSFSPTVKPASPSPSSPTLTTTSPPSSFPSRAAPSSGPCRPNVRVSVPLFMMIVTNLWIYY